MTTDQPLVVRPQGPRVVAYGVALIGVVMTVVVAVSLPDYVRFANSEKVTMTLFAIMVLAVLHGVGRSYVKADAAGVEVLNGYRTHRFTWDQVEGVSMREGAPWPTLVTTDDERVMLFAIQRTDGGGSRDVVRWLRAWADAA
ncbi:MAG: PH domain-containing protein [Aeromicrobium sp.]|uniref:PH domain-containing protein n=1 Tax=Aeromicrobium sp. TaxID=1871063 RepID=UPI0039E59206